MIHCGSIQPYGWINRSKFLSGIKAQCMRMIYMHAYDLLLTLLKGLFWLYMAGCAAVFRQKLS